MPVTSFGPSSGPGPGHGASEPPPIAAMPTGDAVGHGVTRLMARSGAYRTHALFVPGAPPPRGETAGAHGAHKGRISIR